MTDIVRKDIRSYRQLPVNLYQIQVEVPRRDQAAVRRDARPRVPDEGRVFVRRRPRCADEVVPRDVRRLRADLHAARAAVSRRRCGYRCDRRIRVARIPGARRFGRGRDRLQRRIGLRGERRAGRGARAADRAGGACRSRCKRSPTPGQSTCEDVAELLGLPLARTVKCLLVHAQDRVQMLLVRGDHMGNEVKIGKVPGLDGWRWASEAEIVAATGCRPGYLGPVGIPADMPLIVDRQVGVMSDFVCGANEADFHLRGVNFGRDCREPDVVADIRSVVAGDPSPDGKGTLAIVRGIEVGHVFALGRRVLYSDGGNLSGRRRSVARHPDGLLRHRRHARRRRGDRAESRRTGYRLAAGNGTICRGDRADRLRPQRRRFANAQTGCMAQLDRRRDRSAARRSRRASWRDVC